MAVTKRSALLQAGYFAKGKTQTPQDEHLITWYLSYVLYHHGHLNSCTFNSIVKVPPKDHVDHTTSCHAVAG